MDIVAETPGYPKQGCHEISENNFVSWDSKALPFKCGVANPASILNIHLVVFPMLLK